MAGQITARTGLRAMAQARDQVSPPVAVVFPGQPFINYAGTFEGALSLNIVVLVIITDAAPVEKTQRALDAYLGLGAGETESIPGAILHDPTLGGVVHWCEPNTASNYGRVEYAGVTYFGARINLTVGAI